MEKFQVLDPPGEFGDTPNTVKTDVGNHNYSTAQLLCYTERVIQYTLETCHDNFVRTYVTKRFVDEEFRHASRQ